jgi:AraC family transcriptional regulator
MSKSTTTIKIGNMCCSRCITAVKDVFDKSGVVYKNIELGYAEIDQDVIKLIELETILKKAGFELIKSKEEELTEKTKIAIRKLFVETEKIELANFNLHGYLETQVQIQYKRLSELFSKQEKRTIEKYFILQKIEKVKAFIDETSLSFSDIAHKLGYNSLSHLSRQFKELEGISMQNYRLKPKNSRIFIDEV